MGQASRRMALGPWVGEGWAAQMGDARGGSRSLSCRRLDNEWPSTPLKPREDVMEKRKIQNSVYVLETKPNPALPLGLALCFPKEDCVCEKLLA